tara:strand:- start:420 stop:542 length:123 start_codon:yes stop_codon:yes gene_type:complete
MPGMNKYSKNYGGRSGEKKKKKTNRNVRGRARPIRSGGAR